ncbi:MAG: TPD domain-containing protein [Euryarchaeota archaeon]|nr:TPD domain-containing protein [Euryarchaeota archaeon]
MDYKEYKRLYDGLVDPEDLDRFEEEGYDRRLLDTLYTQKVSRSVKKRFHVVKNNARNMLREWHRGKSFSELSKKYRFPPILVMMMIFQEDGLSKKQFWSIIRNPGLLESPETAAEVREAVGRDPVYSPAANDRQKERGEWGEGLLQGWLDEQGIEYLTEDEIRNLEGSTKTPDCLLREPMMYDGKKIFWIESKASFGDGVEFRFNSRKQLVPYTQLFGPGVVVYWTGCLKDQECPDNIYLEDMSLLDKKLVRIEQ